MKKFKKLDLSVQFPELKVIEQDGKREYVTPEGKKYPSVTTVMGWKKRAFFAEWRRNNPEASKYALKRGNEFHLLVEKYLNNENVEDSEDAKTKKLFEQIKEELNNIDNIFVQEVSLWSDNLKLAGRVDCIAEYNGKLSIIDFKTSKKVKDEYEIEEYFLQATSYAIMLEERTGIKISDIVIIMSCDDGNVLVFQQKPKRYVKKLMSTIEIYNRENNLLV
jgi:CRISPR/Cas system-associated exonuclease Cas4 (RecB family)